MGSIGPLSIRGKEQKRPKQGGDDDRTKKETPESKFVVSSNQTDQKAKENIDNPRQHTSEIEGLVIAKKEAPPESSRPSIDRIIWRQS